MPGCDADAAAAFVAGLQGRGVRLSVVDGRPLADPVAAITDADREFLAPIRAAVLSFLEAERRAWSEHNRDRDAWHGPDAFGEPSIPAEDLEGCPSCGSLALRWDEGGLARCRRCEPDEATERAAMTCRRLEQTRDGILARLRRNRP